MKQTKRLSDVLFIAIFIGFSIQLFVSPAHSDSHRILNRNGLFDDLTVCSAYDVFLDDSTPKSTIGCDDMTAFLIETGKTPLREFVSEYHKQFPAGSNFELLLYALKIVDQDHQSVAYNNFRIAQNHLFGAFFHSGDVERASIYGVLIERLNREILSAELPPNSRFLSSMPTTDLADRLGVEFNILNGDSPYTELVCFLKVDNLRVPVRKVAASTKLKRCIKKQGLGKE